MDLKDDYKNSNVPDTALETYLQMTIPVPSTEISSINEEINDAVLEEPEQKRGEVSNRKVLKTPMYGNATKENARLRSSAEQLYILNRKASTETSVFSNAIVPSELVLSDCVNSTQDLSKYTPKRRKTFRNALPEIFASCFATSFHIMVGVTFAATASLLPQLEDKDSGFQATKNEIAWIASIFVLVIPVASIFSGFIMETFGRLNAIKLSVVPSIASCILIALSTNVYMLIVGRLLMGIGAAFGTNPAVVYITEITSPEYRGALVSAGPTLSSLGMMLGYLSGAFLPWKTVSWINIAYCIVPLSVILFVPESPTWLVSKERIDQARDSLMWLAKFEDEDVRGKIVDRKLKELIIDREEKMSKMRGHSLWQRLGGLRRPTGYKPLIIMIMMFAFQQYTGVYITTFYAVQFFESAGSSMNPFHASILIGLTRFVMSVVTVFLLKVFRRRPLCLTSCIGMSVSMGISGYYTQRVNQTGENSMIPVYSILVYVCFCMIGLLSLPWTMAAEVFPTDIRGVAHGLVVASAHFIMFISIKTYYEMAEFFGGHDMLQWFFAVMSVLALVFVFFFLPETHKLTLFQIEDYFRHNTIYGFKKHSEQKDPKRESRLSAKTVGIMEPVPENHSEYDTLVKQKEERRTVILPAKTDYKSSGALDMTKIDFIDKSMVELDKMSDS